MVNFREKKAELASIPAERLLAIGIPQVTFYYRNGNYQALCPFHSDKHLGSFGYNPRKGTWKCFVCDRGGAGVYSLIEAVNGWDFKKTIDYLYEHRNDPVQGLSASVPTGLTKAPTIAPSRVSAPATPRPLKFKGDNEADFLALPAATESEIDLIYRSFAQASPLSPAARDKLQNTRGLRYGSMDSFFRAPYSEDEAFWTRFRSLLAAQDEKPGEETLYHKLLSVPGFLWSKEQQKVSFVNFGQAIGILNRDAQGRVSGIEMRTMSNGDGQARYLRFSSEGICARYPDRFAHGTCASCSIDIVQAEEPIKGIAITEGKFKALQLSYMGYTVINIHGVGNWKQMYDPFMQLMEQYGADTPVTIALDADSRTNPAVAEHAMKLGLALTVLGYNTQYMTWSAKLGKGIDDVVIAGHKRDIRFVPAQRFIDTTLQPFLDRAKSRKEATHSPAFHRDNL